MKHFEDLPFSFHSNRNVFIFSSLRQTCSLQYKWQMTQGNKDFKLKFLFIMNDWEILQRLLMLGKD